MLKTLLYPVVFLSCLLLIGCNRAASKSTSATPTASASAATITDQRGNTVTIPANLQRVVFFPMPAPFLWATIAGSTKSIAGMHPQAMEAAKEGLFQDLYPEITSVPTNFVGENFAPNVEELLRLNPDLVIQWSSKGEAIVEPLEQAGIQVVGLNNFGNQEDLESWITIFGNILHKEVNAKRLIDYLHQHLEKTKALTSSLPDSKKPRVLYLSPVKTLRGAGSELYNDSSFQWTGAKNVVSGLKGWQNLTMEQIITWDPEIIYIGNFGPEMPEDLLNNNLDGQDWSHITAVKNKKVYKVPLGGYRWDPPSQESPLMWYWLLQVQHPDLYKDSIRTLAKAFFQDFYGYTVSEAQLDTMLRCETTNQTLPSCQEK